MSPIWNAGGVEFAQLPKEKSSEKERAKVSKHLKKHNILVVGNWFFSDSVFKLQWEGIIFKVRNNNLTKIISTRQKSWQLHYILKKEGLLCLLACWF